MKFIKSTTAIIWIFSLMLLISGLVLLDCEIYWTGGGISSIGFIGMLFSPLMAELIDDEISGK